VDPSGLINDPVLNGLNALVGFGNSVGDVTGKIGNGLSKGIPKAFKGFAGGLNDLSNYGKTCHNDPLGDTMFNYLYLNVNRSTNTNDLPFNLVDQVGNYNDINSALGK